MRKKVELFVCEDVFVKINKISKQKGLTRAELIRRWIDEKTKV